MEAHPPRGRRARFQVLSRSTAGILEMVVDGTGALKSENGGRDEEGIFFIFRSLSVLHFTTPHDNRLASFACTVCTERPRSSSIWGSSSPPLGGIAFLSFMSQHRQFQMGGGGSNAGQSQFGDTTYTKIFVGGLAWETQRDTMRRYFEQFGEIQEAVVITDKNTGRSKGYGFVTFKDPDSAMRACQDPSPVIDGRRANCNLASLGARSGSSTPQHGTGRFRPASGSTTAAADYQHGASTTYFHQRAQYSVPYSAAYGVTTVCTEATNFRLITLLAGMDSTKVSILTTPNIRRAVNLREAMQCSILKSSNTRIFLSNTEPKESFPSPHPQPLLQKSQNPSIHGKTKTNGSPFATGVNAAASSGSSSQGAPVATAEQNSSSQIMVESFGSYVGIQAAKLAKAPHVCEF
ncbi:hypothetical protein ACLOJK_006318 [Asimina triloba]